MACGAVITESTVLDHDLRDCETGLTVAGPGVTLDLGGHRITGRGGDAGVRVAAPGAHIVDGRIQGFAVGVLFVDGSSGATASHLELTGNGTGIGSELSAASELVGILVERSTVRANEAGIVLRFMRASHVVGNQIVGNTGHGIDALRSDGSLIEGNDVSRNGVDGIHLTESTTRVLGNRIERNGGDGLRIDERCGPLLNSYRIGSNETERNGGLGVNVLISCPPGVEPPFDLLDAGGNVAKHNGDPRECSAQVECAKNRGQARNLAPAAHMLDRDLA